jgi:hypothetical protein
MALGRWTVTLLLVLALAGVVRAESPDVRYVKAEDPDDGDRDFSIADRLTIRFSPEEQEVQRSSDGPLDKEAVDALLSFKLLGTDDALELGSNYTAQWLPFDYQERLELTILDATTTDIEAIRAFNFTVSCKPTLMLADGTACDSPTKKAPSKSWGLGRPRLINVTSISSQPDARLAAGDMIRLGFDADVDVLLASSTATDLFTLTGEHLGTDLTGAWLDGRTYDITLNAPATVKHAVADAYTVACKSNAPIKLAGADPASAVCCDPSRTSEAGCEPVAASGSFGRLLLLWGEANRQPIGD